MRQRVTRARRARNIRYEPNTGHGASPKVGNRRADGSVGRR